MIYSYENCIYPYVNNFTFVEVDNDYIDKIFKLSFNIALRKIYENHHKKDCGQELTRLRTGLIGEAALEKLLGISIIDWSVGDSREYNKPDIIDYSLGIKTVEYGKFPVILKKNNYPQIICIKSQNDNRVAICGLATPEILNKYQDDKLILSSNIRDRGVKTGFYGFEYLKPVKTILDISEYKTN